MHKNLKTELCLALLPRPGSTRLSSNLLFFFHLTKACSSITNKWYTMPNAEGVVFIFNVEKMFANSVKPTHGWVQQPKGLIECL